MNNIPPLPPLPPNVVNLPHVVKDADPYQTQFVASLRDQFAMNVMYAILSRGTFARSKDVVEDSYEIADAMMERRKR